MARTVRDIGLSHRTTRMRLRTRTKPYWRALETGLHLGYRRHAKGGSWIARRRTEGGTYREDRLGRADDFQDADGERILDFSQAQRAARHWWGQEQRREQGGSAIPSGPYTVGKALDDYLEDYRRRGGKAADAVQYAVDAHVRPTLGEIAVGKLSARRLQDWHRRIAEQPRRVRTKANAAQKTATLDHDDPEAVRRRRATANRVLTYLKAALNHAWRSGAVPSDDPWRRVKPFRAVDAPVIRYLSEEEITRLLNDCQGLFRDLVLVALLTGCRYGELCRLAIADYNADVGSLNVRTSKGGQARHVTLTEEGVEFVESIIVRRPSGELLLPGEGGTPWGKSHQARPLKEACKRAGINPPVSFHVLRHTHGSHLAMRGVPMAVVAKQLGHADTRMTERHYAHLAPNYVADTIRAGFPQLVERAPSTVVRLRRTANVGRQAV